MIKFVKAIIHGVSDRMKDGMSFTEAIEVEYYMMFHVMGVDLYVKYMNGTAVEGVDFT